MKINSTQDSNPTPGGGLGRNKFRSSWKVQTEGAQVCKVKEPTYPSVQVNAQQEKAGLDSIMILPQVHLRKPCYDFYFL